MTLKQFFFLTLIFSFFSISSPTRADTCLDYQPGQSDNSCAAAYTRQQQTLYFNSPQLGEQSFLVKRVVHKATNTTVHSDFDFSANCNGDGYLCSLSQHDFITLYLTTFREAVKASSFYSYITHIPEPCDPTKQVCCDDNNQCTEIKSIPNQSSSLRQVFIKSVVQALGYKLVDKAFDPMSDPDYIEELSQGEVKLILSGFNSYNSVCKLKGTQCTNYHGTIYNTGADFSHVHSREADDLNRFLRDYFNQNDKQCSSNMRCDTAQLCTISYYCQ